MDAEALRRMDEPALAAYLRRRLRLEAPLEPPLDRQTRQESPEDFVIHAVLESKEEDPTFKGRIIGAVRANLHQFLREKSSATLDDADNEQLASLAFLAAEIGAQELALDFYSVATVEVLKRDVQPPIDDLAVFHLLRTLAQLQKPEDHLFIPFWLALWEERSPDLREAAFYGISCVAPGKALELLPEVLHDEALDLPPMAWHLATERPGPIELGKAAARLPAEDRRKLRQGLVDAGADGQMLHDFDGFPFPDEVVAMRTAPSQAMPRWDERMAA